ncbi:MAG: DUF4326 domain-containing protein [Gemmatimonadaceae bacterium]
MSAPRVVHCRREPYDTYVGRPSPFGNPFVLGKDGTRDEVVAKYRAWLLGQPELVTRAKPELRGKILACWCSSKSCHADVLMEIANG